MKKLWEDIEAKIRALLATAIVAWMLAAGSLAIQWARGLSLTDKTVLTIQLCLLIAGLVLAGFSGWWLFFQCRRRIFSLEHDLVESRKHQPRFQDDCFPDERLPMFHHKTKPGFFCKACAIVKNLESQMHQSGQQGWLCSVDISHFVENPDRPPLPPEPKKPYLRY